jgi:hypothetical protein
MSRSQILDDRSALRSGWPAVFALIVGLLIASFFFRLFYSSPDGGADFDLAYGIIGVFLIIFLAFYKLRKNVYKIRLGTLQSWFQAHIYIGIISVALIAMHASSGVGGAFSVLLVALFSLVILSGIMGSMIYKFIPVSVNKYGSGTLPLAEMEEKIAGYLNEADKHVDNEHKEFAVLYHKTIRPLFVHKGVKWGYLLKEERAILENQKKLFASFKMMAPPQNVYDVSVLGSIAMEKERLMFTWVKLKALKAWLSFHMPLTFAMITATAVHIISILYF